MNLKHQRASSFHWLFLALITIFMASCQHVDESSHRPNFLVILCDDLGFSDLSCYGGEIRTPNLDRLAGEGMRFSQFYNNAKCTQSRATLLSGLYYQQTALLQKENHILLPEILRAAGYTTLMSGKWHLPRTPIDRGFQRFFGFLGGAINYYTGLDFSSGKNFMRLDKEPFTAPPDFYSTDAFTNYAIEFLQERKEEDPFFLYMAYNAPHYPLQVPAQEIEEYRGSFIPGWDRLRDARHQRILNLGFTSKPWELSPRDSRVPAWNQLTQEDRVAEDLLMATYAAMVTRMDTQIGRLLDQLDKTGDLDETVIFFLSDNGGCPYKFNRTPDLPPGPANSDRTYDSEWANLSNVPFRLYKQWAHEGGISTPLIVRWPSVVPANTIATEVGHIVDIVPTILDLTGLEYPSIAGILPLEGQSFAPILKGEANDQERTFFWEFRGHHAVRQGDWKLVAESGQDWELYNMSADRAELKNLASQYPERVSNMAPLYEDWAQRVNTLTHEECVQRGVSTQAR